MNESIAVQSPTPKMISTLRLFTRSGREHRFTTTLVEDSFTRPLRALVDQGYLTMEYTGTQRVYDVTDQGRQFLEGKKLAKKKAEPNEAVRPTREVAGKNGQSAPKAKPTEEASPKAKSKPMEEAKAPEKKKPARSERPVAAAPRITPATVNSTSPLSPVEVIRLMREVRDYADAHEGVDELLAMIRRIEELGERFGGLDCVRESLLAIQEFRRE